MQYLDKNYNDGAPRSIYFVAFLISCFFLVIGIINILGFFFWWEWWERTTYPEILLEYLVIPMAIIAGCSGVLTFAKKLKIFVKILCFLGILLPFLWVIFLLDIHPCHPVWAAETDAANKTKNIILKEIEAYNKEKVWLTLEQLLDKKYLTPSDIQPLFNAYSFEMKMRKENNGFELWTFPNNSDKMPERLISQIMYFYICEDGILRYERGKKADGNSPPLE